MAVHHSDLHQVVFRFLMDLMRLISLAKSTGGPPRADCVMVLSAVVLSTLQRRPFKTQKLAEYLGMPRTTLIRRLADLEDDGWLSYSNKGHIIANEARLNSAEVADLCDQLSTLIHRTQELLLERERKENKTDHIGH